MTEENLLTPTRVNEIFMDCLFRDGESTDDAVVVEGIVSKFGFNPVRLESHREDVRALLSQLPKEFHIESAGGGWSFLNACTRSDGELWTGEHAKMEQLFALGVALDLVSCLLPREMWSALPGGMPYYAVVGCYKP